MRTDIIDNRMDVTSMPVEAQQILCLMAFGFSQASISRLIGKTSARVCQVVAKHDPDGRFHLTKEERSALVAKMWEAKVLEALMHITTEKMEEASVSELARLAQIGSRHTSTIRGGDGRTAQDILKEFGTPN